MSTTIYYAYDKSHRMTKSYPAGATGESRYFTHNQRNMVTQIQDANTAGGADSNRSFAYNGSGERVVVVDGGAPNYWSYDKRKLVSEGWVTGTTTYYNFYRSNEANSASTTASNVNTTDPCPPPYIEIEPGHPTNPPQPHFYPGTDQRGSVNVTETYNGSGDHSVNTAVFNVFGQVLASATQSPVAQRLGWLSGRGLLSLTTTQPLMAARDGQIYDPRLGLFTVGAGGGVVLTGTLAGLGVAADEDGGGLLLQQGESAPIDSKTVLNCSFCTPTSVTPTASGAIQNPNMAETMGKRQATANRLGPRGPSEVGFTFEVNVGLKEGSTWDRCTYKQYVKRRTSFQEGRVPLGAGYYKSKTAYQVGRFPLSDDAKPDPEFYYLSGHTQAKDDGSTQDDEKMELDAEFLKPYPTWARPLIHPVTTTLVVWSDSPGHAGALTGYTTSIREFRGEVWGTDDVTRKKPVTAHWSIIMAGSAPDSVPNSPHIDPQYTTGGDLKWGNGEAQSYSWPSK